MLDTRKEFEAIIRQLGRSHNTWQVFQDWCEMTANAIDNIWARDEGIEKRHREILARYDAREQELFPKLLALTVDGVDIERDFLGEIFMGLELGNHWRGQFFTPIHVCKLMACVSFHGLRGIIEEQGFVRVMEPACGAGAMVLGMASVLKEQGFNYQQHLHVTAVDVDATAASMCFIQLTLHHIPARVIIGDSLAGTTRRVLATPAHWMGGWPFKLESVLQDSVEAIRPSVPGEQFILMLK